MPGAALARAPVAGKAPGARDQRQSSKCEADLDAHTDRDTRECKLLQDLGGAVEECDIEVFTDAVAEYDSVSKLDKWKTTLLLRIKNAMKESDLT